ncbi:AsmA family protein [Ehrlichia muris]|uniref:AsmA family protein n=1 Tax=Ehrlichia muris TaxID=35795 RepID=UPI0037C04CF2
MRFLIYSGGVILIFLLFLIISPFFINWDSYYTSHVLKQIEDISSDITVKGVGEITGKFILPKIVINNLYIEGHSKLLDHKSTILVNQLELKISLLSLLLFSPKIDTVTIDGLNVSLRDLIDLFSSSRHKSFNIRTFNIVNSVVNTNYDGTSNSKPMSIKNGTINTVNGARVISGLLSIGKNDYNLVANISRDGEHNRINVDVYSQLTKVTLSGMASDSKFDGMILANGSDFSQFINDISETNKTSIFSFINSHEKFSLSSNVKLSDKAFALSDFKIFTDSVEGVGKVVCSSYLSCDSNIDFAKIDIDRLYGLNREEGVYKRDSRILDYFNTLISENLNYNIKASAKEIKYHGKISTNLIIDLAILQGKVNVNKMTAILPGNNNVLYIEGNVASNDLISNFQGKLKIIGDDFYSFAKWLFPIKVDSKPSSGFSIQSDLYIAPRVFSLSHIEVLTENFGDMKGQLKIKHDKKSSSVIGDVEIRNIDFSQYKIDEELNTENFMLMRWLKDIKYKINVDTNINNFVIQKQKVDNLSFLVSIAQGKFGINKIRFHGADGSDLNGFIKASIGSQDLKPKILVNLKGNKYNTAFIKFPSLIRNIFDESNRVNNIKWSNEDFKFYGLEHVDGNIDINIKNFVSRDSTLVNFVFSSSLKDNLMSINKLMFKVDDGFVSASGKVGMGSNTSSLSAVISIANVGVNSLLKYINVNGVTGNVSISGSIQTQGRTLVDWVNALDGKMEIVAKGVSVAGVDFNKFIVELLDVQSKSDVAALTQIGLYKNNTVFNFINAGANIKRGNILAALQFAIDNASGVASANISLLQFAVVSKARLSFMRSGASSPSNIDMSVHGQLWQPKISFNVNALYEEVVQGNNRAVSTQAEYDED